MPTALVPLPTRTELFVKLALPVPPCSIGIIPEPPDKIAPFKPAKLVAPVPPLSTGNG
jgi:hypothetical protein